MAKYINLEDAVETIGILAIKQKKDNRFDSVHDALCYLEGLFRTMDSADVVEVVHGRWILEAHEEYANYRWNVTAECSECHEEKKEVYAEFITGFPKDVAEQIVLEYAESVKLPNYCPNCGADMRGWDDGQG